MTLRYVDTWILKGKVRKSASDARPKEEGTGGPAGGGIENCRQVTIVNRFSKEGAYRCGKMGEMQGQSPEGTGERELGSIRQGGFQEGSRCEARERR